ncbi:MAG TPA: hypothetical protein VFW28_06685 [Micropepsaceae bacterium]|nr:hypothetical protein [Micropepsaceae bacterium]
MESELEKAAKFYNRAAELRGIAENVKDADTKDALVKWAETYEVIAGRIIEALPDGKPGASI